MDSGKKLQDTLQQLAMLGLALTEAQAIKNAPTTKVFIARAILSARKEGVSAEVLEEIFEKAFPGTPIPKDASSEEYQMLIRDAAADNS